jgi:hypothetical protein
MPATPARDTGRDLRAGAVVVAVLAVIGALLGLVWAWWAPPSGTAFARSSDGVTWLIDENESSIAADGRFAVLTIGLGVVAGIGLYLRPRLRGPIGVLALALGCLLATQLVRLVGWLAGGGSDTGPACQIYLDQIVDGHCIQHVRLAVHASSLSLLGPAAAVLVHGMLVSFAGRDDLGRRDDVRQMLLRRRVQQARQLPDGPFAPGPDQAASVGEGGQA